MDKDELLEFLDRVGARSLESFLTEQTSDPQEGLSERLDWARSRLADPRYSVSARFLVENETEIRAIMREGEQSWLYRQLMGEREPVETRSADSLAGSTSRSIGTTRL